MHGSPHPLADALRDRLVFTMLALFSGGLAGLFTRACLSTGATQLPLPGLPVVGSWLTSRIKGKGLFIAENWARLGQSYSPASTISR